MDAQHACNGCRGRRAGRSQPYHPDLQQPLPDRPRAGNPSINDLYEEAKAVYSGTVVIADNGCWELAQDRTLNTIIKKFSR